MIIVNTLILTSMLFGSFMPGVTVDQYGRMIMDISKTQVVVRSVIPETTIESTARCKMVLGQMDLIAKALDEYDAVFVRKGKEVVHLYLTHGSKPEDFQRLVADMDEARDQGEKKILDARFKMKEVMTPEEWKAVFRPQG